MFLTGKEPLKVTLRNGLRYCGSGDILALVCHVILLDHMIKRSYNFMSSSFSSVAILPCLVAINTGSGDIVVLVCLVTSLVHVVKGHVILWVKPT